MLGHLYLNWEVVKEATTKKKGLKECKCEKCGGATLTEEIPKKKVHKNIDSRIEIGTMKFTNDPCYRYGKCLIVDKRSWGEVPIVEVTDEGGLRCTYYNKEGKKKVFAFAQLPTDDTIWMYTIQENGNYTDILVGSYS